MFKKGTAWKEIKPFTWFIDGIYAMNRLDFDTYESYYHYLACDLFDPIGAKSMGGVAIRNDKAVWENCHIENYKVEIAPFVSCDIIFPFDRGTIEPPIINCVEKGGGRFCIGSSESNSIRILQQVAEYYGISLSGTNIIHRDEPKSHNDVSFMHCIGEFGWHSSYFCEYRFDDLLNMDASKFSEFEMYRFEREVRRIPILEQSLNFDVFKRPLTDIEKVKCASKFFNIFPKHFNSIQNYLKRKRYATS